MATFAAKLASGSSGGQMVKVAQTATPGTLIHATGISATDIDEVTLWATNNDTVTRTLTVEFGGTGNPDDRISVPIPPKSGLLTVMVGARLSGTGSVARNVRAYADAANVVCVLCQVDRIS